MNSNIFRIAWQLNGSTDVLQNYGIHLDHVFVRLVKFTIYNPPTMEIEN